MQSMGLRVNYLYAVSASFRPNRPMLYRPNSPPTRISGAFGVTNSAKVLSVLLETMDRFRQPPFGSRVFFLATCPDAAALDPSLLQRGRLETVLQLGALDVDARGAILGIHARGMPLALLPPPPPPPLAAAVPDTMADPSLPTACLSDDATDILTQEEEATIRLAEPNAPTVIGPAVAATTLPRTRKDFLGLVAARCHGYLGSDLERLCREAAMSHMSTTAKAPTVDAPYAATAAANTRTEVGDKAHGPEHAGCRDTDRGSMEGAGKGGREDGDGSSGGETGVTLRDFWAALDVVRPASLVGHSVGIWGGDVGREVRPTGTQAWVNYNLLRKVG